MASIPSSDVSLSMSAERNQGEKIYENTKLVFGYEIRITFV